MPIGGYSIVELNGLVPVGQSRATATAIAMHKTGKTKAEYIILETKGGTLEVTFEVKKEFLGLKIKEYTNVWLIGGADFVFEGTISI